ncbi:hypothetical protein NKT34_10630 [Paenibacillus polysaccharolyticus]|uniref:hypothetical protein n=1 Tax=Paenibacillus polysaccharolyticus TaxID=582692 RepID=UPI0020A002F1|nr:hypothetical protein [Paenibacillus polysaccharolyticus]MCP1133745.1 hypothetical protein [Paenibacillus polysaccharolyticus]
MTLPIKVIYPPLKDPSEIPFLLTSCISSVQASYTEIEFVDANLLFWNDVVDSDAVKERYQQLESEWDHLHVRNEIQPEDQEYVRGLIRAFLRRDLIEKNLSDAVQAMKTKCGVREREEARNLIRYAIELFQLPYLPTQLAMNDINLLYSTESTAQLEKSVTDEKTNPFKPFLKSIIETEEREWIIWIESDQQIVSAYTLTALIREKNTNASISWAGPFFSDFGRALISNPPMNLAQVIAVRHPQDFILHQSSKHDVSWGFGELESAEYWTPYRDVRVQKNWMQDDSFFSWLTESKHLADKRLYLYEPTTLKEALHFGERLEKSHTEVPWGIYLKFDQSLKEDELIWLKSRGLRWVHWEIKGWLESDNVEQVKQKMLQTWQACRSQQLPVYHSVVLGYPLTSPKGFTEFISFLKEHSEWTDRYIRFKIFRLYEGSSFWNKSKEYGIERIVEKNPEKDLQRSYPFRTETGWDSKHFLSFASSLVGELQHKERYDFPRDVLAVDDTELFLDPPRKADSEAEPVLKQDLVVSLSPSCKMYTLPYSLSELEKSMQPTVPGKEKEYASVAIERKETRILYDCKKDSFITISPAIVTVLTQCKNPITIGNLLNKFPEKQEASVRKLLLKLYTGGILVEETGATISS